MFDARMRQLIDPPLNHCAAKLARSGLTADQITVAGFAFGMAGAVAICFGAFWVALLLVLAGRLCDGLDGPVARASNSANDRGGYLDISLDFVFYASVPIAFAIHDPAGNSFAAALLLGSFFINGSTFLAFARLADQNKLHTTAQGHKSFYYMSGLVEGTETIVFFIVFCIWPEAFNWLALIFASLCWASGLARIVVGYNMLAPSQDVADRPAERPIADTASVDETTVTNDK